MGTARMIDSRKLPRLQTNEDHWLWWARCGYLNGKTDTETFEQAVDDALHGRPVNFDGTPARGQPADRLGQYYRPDPDLLARTLA